MKSALEIMYQTNSLKDMFKKEKNLIASVQSFDTNEIKEIYEKLNIPENTPKINFINKLEEEIKKIF